jgi:hypothetical protein
MRDCLPDGISRKMIVRIVHRFEVIDSIDGCQDLGSQLLQERLGHSAGNAIVLGDEDAVRGVVYVRHVGISARAWGQGRRFRVESPRSEVGKRATARHDHPLPHNLFKVS